MQANQVFTPDKKLMTKYVVTTWLVFLIGVFPFIFLGLIPELGWVYVILFMLANAIWIIVAHLLIAPYYRSISYQMTDKEITVCKGIITKTENVVPYRMVTNVSVKRGPLDRLFGIGTLEIHTAGYSQQTNAEAQLSGLTNYAEVHKGLMTALRSYRQETTPAVAPITEAAVGNDVADLLREILDEVRGMRRDRS